MNNKEKTHMEQPTAVIADAIAEFMPEGDGGQDGLANLANAQSVIAALRAAGYSVMSNPYRHAMTDEQQQELAQFINRHSLENGCDIPDFAIASYLAKCYQALCRAAESKVDWPKTLSHGASQTAVTVCNVCGRERTPNDALDYNPIQVVTRQLLGWYSGDDGEICPECMAQLIGRTN
ncbi:hypothetical protein [Mycobacteroides abscessus]|uniref:hypothetical protein n=1 Tax=Mycobacteroides abscessus TaxID=36809 RepID=UPI00037BB72A|nr:hypothetical protein [Mycobacteroides abscessus]